MEQKAMNGNQDNQEINNNNSLTSNQPNKKTDRKIQSNHETEVKDVRSSNKAAAQRNAATQATATHENDSSCP